MAPAAPASNRVFTNRQNDGDSAMTSGTLHPTNNLACSCAILSLCWMTTSALCRCSNESTAPKILARPTFDLCDVALGPSAGVVVHLLESCGARRGCPHVLRPPQLRALAFELLALRALRVEGRRQQVDATRGSARNPVAPGGSWGHVAGHRVGPACQAAGDGGHSRLSGKGQLVVAEENGIDFAVAREGHFPDSVCCGLFNGSVTGPHVRLVWVAVNFRRVRNPREGHFPDSVCCGLFNGSETGPHVRLVWVAVNFRRVRNPRRSVLVFECCPGGVIRLRFPVARRRPCGLGDHGKWGWARRCARVLDGHCTAMANGAGAGVAWVAMKKGALRLLMFFRWD